MYIGIGTGLVVLLKLLNPIFLAGPWLVLGKVLELAVSGQLWVHVWATLEGVFPGRIDLGIGRAPGSDQRTALALRRGPGSEDLDAQLLRIPGVTAAYVTPDQGAP